MENAQSLPGTLRLRIFRILMSIQHENGKWGEDLAAAYLAGAGFDLLERNWRYKRAEIDLVAKEGDILVFVEVKTRAYTAFGRPEEMVNPRKRRLLTDAAMAYMRSIGHEWEIRFDIISVLGQPGKAPQITHFRDAFFPSLE